MKKLLITLILFFIVEYMAYYLAFVGAPFISSHKSSDAFELSCFLIFSSVLVALSGLLIPYSFIKDYLEASKNVKSD